MITKENYDKNHILLLQEKSKRDPQLLERTLHAFGLLEALCKVNMPFIFKGGTCLMLLLEHTGRLSTDIDIIVKPGTPIERYIDAAGKIFPFHKQEEQIRVGRNQIEKRHFKFTYTSPISGKDIYILLDVVFENSPYTNIIEKEIKSELLLSEGENLRVKIPSVNCILGDKLTAFAPHTTGIPLNVGKDMEIMKQMYDVSVLIDHFDNYDEMSDTYKHVAEQEMSYRGNIGSIADVMQDTFDTAYCIASRGKVLTDEYPLYVNGIRSLRSHIYAENYSAEIAAIRAVKIMYTMACLLKNVPFERIENCADYKEDKYLGNKILPLKYLRKIDLEAYAYSIKTDRLLSL